MAKIAAWIHHHLDHGATVAKCEQGNHNAGRKAEGGSEGIRELQVATRTIIGIYLVGLLYTLVHYL